MSPNQLNGKMLSTNKAATINAINGARPGKAMNSRNAGLDEDYEELLNSIVQDDRDLKETRG